MLGMSTKRQNDGYIHILIYFFRVVLQSAVTSYTLFKITTGTILLYFNNFTKQYKQIGITG